MCEGAPKTSSAPSEISFTILCLIKLERCKTYDVILRLIQMVFYVESLISQQVLEVLFVEEMVRLGPRLWLVWHLNSTGTEILSGAAKPCSWTSLLSWPSAGYIEYG